MRPLLLVTFATLLAMTSSCSPESAPESAPESESEAALEFPPVDPLTALLGRWDAGLASPGGHLAFGLEFAQLDGALTAHLINGEERIAVPRVELVGNELLLGIDHYDAQISAQLNSPISMEGEWTKRRGPSETTTMAFSALQRGAVGVNPIGTTTPLTGRWRVQFESDAQPAVALIEVDIGGTARGTVLTTTGDYRYLAGSQSDRSLQLSCFDGAHAFLFRAELQDDGSLAGDFWSRESWHETWTAVRDDEASLPDGFALTKWTDAGSLSELAFPDLNGVVRALDAPAFAGQARILQVFGSWCPNCHDASAFMSELHERYGPQGLSIVGLAFELTGEFQRDARQVRRYAERHGVRYPLLVAGLADKAAAGEVLPVLDAVRSYPTTIFLHGDGRVRAVYQGFSGPATDAAHDQLRAAFIAIIEELLAEAG